MPLNCPHCQKALDISGEPPRFCPYCGQGLATGGSSLVGSGVIDMTQDPNATIAYKVERTTASSWPSGEAPPTIAIPARLAGFRLIRLLGQGGMGSVHEAEDVETGRRVALKLMAPEFMSSQRAVERFLQEGRLASTISHPRCVFVLAADEAEGWPFIVMELMPGTTLKDLVESTGPMSARRAIEVILDVIEGLEEAHRRGVIHRDVKPSNCFIDGEGRIKVGDFGLSKSIVDDSGLTRAGSFLGTPHFASAEQLRGEQIDERSDVYSVCATLFYLLTGRTPFEGADATSTVAKIVTDPLPSARTHRPDLWVPLDRVISRGLERDRKRRWANLEELRLALSPFLPGRVNLSSLGLRIAAYAIDFLLGFLLISLMMAIVRRIQGENVPGVKFVGLRFRFNISDFLLEEIVSGIVILIYYSLFEILGEASPGKRLLRLRVGSAQAGPASLKSRAIRLACYLAGVALPRRACALILTAVGLSNASIVWSAGVAQLVGPLILFCTARPSNGYRGLHEFASGTAVVRLPWRFRRRRKQAESQDAQTFHLSAPDGLPEELGSFKVDGALRWSETTRLLQAEDEGLRRPVWIEMRPDSSSATTRARTDLARLTRLRWLQSGARDGWRWDAFVAPTGVPLINVARGKRRGCPWSETREILEELATELVDATCDGTLPDHLAVEQIWIKPNGRVLLLDVAPAEPRPSFLGSDHTHAHAHAATNTHVQAKDPQERGLELLGRVATVLLKGDHPHRDGIHHYEGAPIPKHAVPILDGLTSVQKPYPTIEKFREAIHGIRDLPSELTPLQQIGHATYTLIGGLAKIFLFPALYLAFEIALILLGRSEPPARFSPEIWRSILAFEMLLWVLVAMIVREGPAGLVFNLGLVTRKGRPASRLNFAPRELMVVGPVYLFNLALAQLQPTSTSLSFAMMYGGVIFAVLWPVLNVLPVLIAPGRYLVDRVGGTTLVPR